MKMPGSSLTAVAMPISSPRGHRGRGETQSKMHIVINAMPS
jgi:hypothetical protein